MSKFINSITGLLNAILLAVNITIAIVPPTVPTTQPIPIILITYPHC